MLRWTHERRAGPVPAAARLEPPSGAAAVAAHTWRWEAIVDIVPGGLVDARTGNGVPELKVRVTMEGDRVEEHHIPVDSLASHAWLVYAVLRFWSEHPELRDELHTSTAQERMASWMAGLSKAADAQGA